MVFGLFKKKKKTPQAQPLPQGQDPHLAEQPAPEKLELHNVLKDSKTSKSKSPAVAADNNEDQWMYESVIQFLRSPLWKVPILSFLDENCIIFDEDEENTTEEHLQAHEEFKKLVHRLINDLMNELEISEEKMMDIIQIGLKNKQDKKYFERLVVADNFNVFKNQMLKRNKQLELEALQQLHDMEIRAPSNEEHHVREESRSLQKLTLEKEQAEIEHALALSLAVEEERKKLEEQEDYELQEALRQSQVDFDRHQEGEREKERQKEREIAREIERQRQKQRELEEQEARAMAQALEQAAHKEDEGHDEEEKVDPYKMIKSKKLEPLSNAPKPGHIEVEQRGSFLPPIHGDGKFEPMSLDQLLQEKDRVGSQIQQIKQEETHTESLEERKKRLKAQRDLILAKKKAEREAELRNYEAKKEAIPKENVIEPKVSQEELEKRKEIYNKLKSEL